MAARTTSARAPQMRCGLTRLALAIALAGICCSNNPEVSSAPRPAVALGPPVAGQARRIASLAPSLSELLLALDASMAGRIVGVTRFDDAPALAEVPRVGGYVDPSVEAVLALGPDLILAEAAPGNRGAMERLAGHGIPVRAFFLGTRAEILASIEAIAGLVGQQPKGRALRADIERRLKAVEDLPRAGPLPRALIVYGWAPIVVAGPGTFADELLRAAGGRNALEAARVRYPTLTAEALIDLSPDLIVDAAHDRPPVRRQLLSLLSDRGSRLVEASSALRRPGIRIADAVEELHRALWPEKGPRAIASSASRDSARPAPALEPQK